MSETIPCISYGVNTEVLSSSSPPKALSSGDRLNYIQFNQMDDFNHGCNIVRLYRDDNSVHDGFIWLRVVEAGEKLNLPNNVIDIRLDFHDLCKIAEIFKAMVKNEGEMRGLARKSE